MVTATLHMIGNAHIDPVWLWQWQEGFQEVLATFRSGLDRMQEDDDFRFTASSAAFFTWVARVDPEMLAEIQARVAEGRWELAGGWWIEPDCNIPSGESFARHALYGQRYFREAFGTTARVGYAVDSFGHNATLPQLLRLSGLDFYVFMRPGPHEKGLPGRLFWWEANDGSRVLAYRLPFSYATWGDNVEPHIRRCAAEMKPPIDELACFYGVGNHGGGPTQENLATIRRLGEDPELPMLRFSTLTDFFERVEEKGWPLPVVHDELQHHASGCYAAHSGVKRWNRQAENALLRAEIWAAVASQVTGVPYPGEALAHAWTDVLFNQFHDIMAGTSLEEAYEDARDLYGEALAVADRALNDAIQSMAWAMQIPQEEGVKPIAVFNPHGWATRSAIELEAGRVPSEVTLVDDAGNAVSVQRIQSHATAWGRTRIAFVADLPPLGYRVYRLRPQEDSSDSNGIGGAGPSPAGEPTPMMLESDRLRLTFDPETGYLTSLYDRAAEIEVLAGPAARPVMIEDRSDTWSHGVFRFDRALEGAFELVRMAVTETGPVRTTVTVESAWGQSTLVQAFSLYQGLERVDVHVTVDWHEQFKLLKLRFPLALGHYKVTHEIPYGHIERAPTGEEEPMQRWVDISGSAANGTAYGLSLLNDGKYSVDVTGNEIGLTVLRSPVYAHHDPAEIEPDGDYAFIDQGVQTFTYSLYPHRGSWEDAGTVRQAAELNQPPVALIATARPAGRLPLVASYVSVEPTNIVLTALKQAEDGDDLIVRAYESAGRATEATIRLPLWERTIEAEFRPGEIKTWRVPADGDGEVVEVNFLETEA